MKNLKVSVRDYQSAIAAESETCDQLIDAQQVQLEVVLRETAELERIQRCVDESMARMQLLRAKASYQAEPSLPLGSTSQQRSEDIATAKEVVTEADQNYAAQVYGQQKLTPKAKATPRSSTQRSGSVSNPTKENQL